MNKEGYITERVQPVPDFAKKWMDFVYGDIFKDTEPTKKVTAKTF